MSREAIELAMLTRLETISGVVMLSRKLRHWDDVSADEQPAIFVAKEGETAERTAQLPIKWRRKYWLWVYVNTQDDLSPATPLNALLDAIEAVFEPTLTGTFQTLGGLVEHARIEGKIEVSEGTLGNQEVAKIPISILTY